MPFSSQHGLVVTQSSALIDVLNQDGHSVIGVPDGVSVLPLLVTNPHVDLLVLDTWLHDLSLILQTLTGLVHIPGRIVIRDVVAPVPEFKNTTVIILDSKVSDSVLSHSISQSFAPLVEPEKRVRQVLIIDDVVDLLEMYRMMFGLKGYDIETAVDGLDGISKASQYKPDIILLDIMMPHMDGYEMMKTLRENTSLQSVIVVNSNIEGSDVVEKVYSSGADYYLRKSDFTPSQIVYMVEKWLFDKKRKKTDSLPLSHFHPGADFFVWMSS